MYVPTCRVIARLGRSRHTVTRPHVTLFVSRGGSEGPSPAYAAVASQPGRQQCRWCLGALLSALPHRCHRCFGILFWRFVSSWSCFFFWRLVASAISALARSFFWRFVVSAIKASPHECVCLPLRAMCKTVFKPVFCRLCLFIMGLQVPLSLQY